MLPFGIGYSIGFEEAWRMESDMVEYLVEKKSKVADIFFRKMKGK